jgi:hypothetical protein
MVQIQCARTGVQTTYSVTKTEDIQPQHLEKIYDYKTAGELEAALRGLESLMTAAGVGSLQELLGQQGDMLTPPLWEVEAMQYGRKVMTEERKKVR